MNNKKLIRLTEADLHRIVRESVNKVLNEIGDTPRGQYMLGRTAARYGWRGNMDKRKEIEDYAKAAQRKNAKDTLYDTARLYGLDTQWDMDAYNDNSDSKYAQQQYNNTLKRMQNIYNNLPNYKAMYRNGEENRAEGNVYRDDINMRNYVRQ